jgi:N-acetyl sugar amidotransferase
VPSITFDEDGVCNYCRLHDQMDAEYPTGPEGEKRLREMANRIRHYGRNRQYDVVVGVSGGCDSSYMLYYAKQVLGLRPLAVHFDNTWNSTTATGNIRRILDALDVDLYTYVVDNTEYDDIYRAFMRAGVPDIDAPTDIGLASVLSMAAEKYRVKYIFEGHSFRTEGISPLGWLYMDGRYIQSVHRAFGERRMRTYPNMTLARFIRWTALRGIRKLRPLYFIDYHKQDAMKLLESKLGWKWYGGHHLENRFTAFYHSYFIPERFGADLRILGYAALVRSDQMSRSEGKRLLALPREHDEELVELVKKRLGYSDGQFRELMGLPKRSYRDFDTYKRTFERLRWFWWLMYRLDRVPKSFYLKFAVAEMQTAAQLRSELGGNAPGARAAGYVARNQ